MRPTWTAPARRHTAQELDMLDPREQAKGGFRAQVARRNEHQEQLAAAAPEDGTPTPAEDQADGAAVLGPHPQVLPAPPNASEARPVKRWR
jgi:hypothetical protein